MDRLKALLAEYDRLGAAEFSSPHDYVLRQRKLEAWADRAREAIAEILRANPGPDLEPQARFDGPEVPMRQTGP